jgi:hypothetical protein
MRIQLWLAASALALTATPTFAQTAPDAEAGATPASAEATQPYEGESGLLIYPPAFFADARPNNALDMVSRIPGFSINQNTSVRGFSGAVGNVLFDGSRPASKDESLSGLLQRIPAEQVERIELIRGGAPGVDMQGYSTVINVIQRTTDSRRVTAYGGAFVFDDGRYIPQFGIELSGTSGERQYSLALNSTTSLSDGVGSGDVRRYAADGSLIREETLESEADGTGLSLRGRWQQPLFGGEIEVNGNAGYNGFKYEQNTFGPIGDRYLTDSADNRNGEISLRYARPISERLRTETRFIQRLRQNEGQQSFVTPGMDQVFAYDNTSGETILRGAVTFQQSDTLTFEGGAEGAFNFLDAQQALTVGGAPVPLPSDSVRVEELRGELFGSSTWRPTDELTLEGGLRIERSTISQSGGSDLENTFTFLKPRASLTWTPSEHDQLRLRVEREVGQLNFGDFAASAELANNVVSAGNADLAPQSAWVLEAAWERRFWEDGIVSATVQHQIISDAIDVIPVTDGVDVYSAPGNIGDGSLTYVNLEWTIPLDRLGISGGQLTNSLTWRVSEVTDPTTGEDRKISGVRPEEFFTRFQQDIDSWRMNWGVEYQPFGEDTVYRIDQVSHFRFRDYASAWIEYKPTDQWTLRAQAWMLGSYDQTRTVFAGPRGASPVAYTEIRSMEPESRIQLRLRRTF